MFVRLSKFGLRHFLEVAPGSKGMSTALDWEETLMTFLLPAEHLTFNENGNLEYVVQNIRNHFLFIFNFSPNKNSNVFVYTFNCICKEIVNFIFLDW